MLAAPPVGVWRTTMTISAGEPAPDVELVSSDGVKKLSDHKGSWVVLYFYPADNTPGCTAEACSFRDAYEDFTDAGAVVIGVSGNTLESHDGFAAKHSLPFTLITDEDGSIRKAYGVKKSLGIIDGRVTFVIDPEGVVRKVFSSQLRPKAHQAEALAVIKAG
jgi:peroxiredoxin Q/BCP